MLSTTQSPYPVTATDLPELAGDILISELKGEILLIRTAHELIVCERSSIHLKDHLFSWLLTARTEPASFIGGKVSENGGRFQILKKDEAVNLLETWNFQELQHGMR